MDDCTKPDAFRWIRLARKATGPPSARLVLYAIASFANERGESFPRVGTLMDATGLTRRGVQKALRNLQADGWISVRPGRRRNTGRPGANVYRIVAARGELSAP